MLRRLIAAIVRVIKLLEVHSVITLKTVFLLLLLPVKKNPSATKLLEETTLR